jgi:NAD(P)H-flavin reductase
VTATEAAIARPDAWSPSPHRVVERRPEAPGVATLTVEATAEPLAVPMPGQFHMVWAGGVGEAPISVSRIGSRVHEFTIAEVGAVTTALVAMDVGDVVGLRGPFGTSWPVDPDDDRDLLVVAGGLGLAPVRPVVDAAVAAARRTSVVIGARSPEELLFDSDRRRWAEAGLEVHVTVDRPTPAWVGEVGLVTAPLGRAVAQPTATTAVVCGPEVMMRVTAERLEELGLARESISVSLERNMQCGLGQCGRCQLGPVLVCRDGPVLPWTRAEPLLEVRGW